MSLKLKTIKGAFWNAFELLGGKLVQVIITIFLARILSPEDFGVIGLLVIFTELSKVILDSGFSQALIRKQDARQEDYTSIFYFNVFIGIFLYIILYLVSPSISIFYNYPELTDISRAIFLTIFINSFGVVQNAKIVKDVNFKILANRTIIANLFSGLFAIYLAYEDFGVWALVIQMITASFLRVILLWSFSKWWPSFSFSIIPIKKLFAFSSNLLVSGVFDVIVSNIQTLLIGKFYTKADLGFYSQAKQLSSIPSQTLTSIITNVTYPTLSTIQNRLDQLKVAYRQIIRISLFTVLPLMLILLAIANNLIPLILGDKWIPAIDYFVLLCISGAFFPLNTISLSILLVRGNSKLYLRLSIIKRIITLLAIVITINYSVLALVIGQVVANIVNIFITMIFSGKEINYIFKEQFNDIYSIILLSGVISFVTYFYGFQMILNSDLFIVILNFCSAYLTFILLSFIFKLRAIEDLNSVYLILIRGKNS